MNQGMAIHYDPRLVEEAVFHIQRDSFVRKELDEQRKRIYEVPDPDHRERQFLDLNRIWFNRLGLGNGVEGALREQPLITAQVGNCFIVCAIAITEESAELFVPQDTRLENPPERTLRILLRPESLLNAVSLKTFLRHELFHIADMLDPTFAYKPTLPKAEGGPTYDTLITNRYRVLWDVTISGRMLQRGWCDASVREQQFSDFVHAFPMLQEDRLDELFSGFFDSEQPKHADLACFAFDPRHASGSVQRHAAPGTHCPLCRFPTHAFEAEPSHLGTEVLAALKEDFPNWTASLGLCVQCADLYRSRQMSADALRLLPGYNLSSKRA
jgi:hypothetical protein